MAESSLPTGSWLASADHHRWLAEEGDRLQRFSRASRLPEGFGSLDDRGSLPEGTRADTLTTARMTHSYALAHLQGIPGAGPLVDHGLASLAGPLRDTEHGGWFAQPMDGPHADSGKAAYVHAFVALAASSAFLAGRRGADELLKESANLLGGRFWSEEEGALREAFVRDWSRDEAYRGANANMHGVEAMLALADAQDDPIWLDRALSMVERVVRRHVDIADHLVVEHFDQRWQPLPDYNAETPDDPFRPFGLTPGHAFEWSRLLLHLEASRQRFGLEAPDWLMETARHQFDSAARFGWNVDGAPGIVYTVDWAKAPQVRQRLHWTLAEAINAAAALLRRTGESGYESWYRRFWDYTDRYLIDRDAGSWHHELGPDNTPDSRIWAGKGDLYHAYQATLVPRLPLAPGLALALRKAGLQGRPS